MLDAVKCLKQYPCNVLLRKIRKAYLARGRSPNAERTAGGPGPSAPQERIIQAFEADRELQALEREIQPVESFLRRASCVEWVLIEHRYWRGETWEEAARAAGLSASYARGECNQRIINSINALISA